MRDFNVQGKVGVITGGAGNLGNLIAQHLSQSNTIHSFDMTTKEDEKNIFYHQVDISKEEEVRALVKSIGKVDFLINCAALQVTKSFEKMSIDEFKKSIDVNLNGAYVCTKAVSDVMMQQMSGNIINIGSIYGVVSADPNLYGSSGLNSPDSYAASKGGLIQLTKYLAVNLAKYNIRVNAISPGGVFNNQPQEFLEKYLPKVPMNRMMDKEEILGPVQFILSDASSYITGHNLVIDGGFTII